MRGRARVQGRERERAGGHPGNGWKAGEEKARLSAGTWCVQGSEGSPVWTAPAVTAERGPGGPGRPMALSAPAGFRRVPLLSESACMRAGEP